jgi:hypothetical protein
MLISFLIILAISIILAVRSMKDFNVPSEINNLILGKKVKGKIVFFKNKIVHYQAKRS